MALDVLTRIGEFVLYLGLGYFFLIVVLAVSGETIQAWPLRRTGRTGGGKSTHAEDQTLGPLNIEEGLVGGQAGGRRAPSRRVSTEKHLEFLDRLRTNLKYQGSTIALIVFAVLVLGLQHVLDGPEIGTLLAGITGYVLGTSRGGSENQAPAIGGAVGPNAGSDPQPNHQPVDPTQKHTGKGSGDVGTGLPTKS